MRFEMKLIVLGKKKVLESNFCQMVSQDLPVTLSVPQEFFLKIFLSLLPLRSLNSEAQLDFCH